MPEYEFACPSCGATKSVFHKTLPSEAKQRHSTCESCDGKMNRVLSPFFATGGTNFEVQKSGMMAMEKFDQGGRKTPFFKDENGKLHEVRNSKDIDKWRVSNTLGRPRMVEWKNPLTGQNSWVPQRTVMEADPTTGEPKDKGSVIRESARLVPLQKNYTIPPADRKLGERLNSQGVLARTDKTKKILDSCMAKNEGDDMGGRGGIDPRQLLPSKG